MFCYQIPVIILLLLKTKCYRKNNILLKIYIKNIEFVLGKHGVREPSLETGEVVSSSCIDFVVTPGLAFDTFGNRIGYGGGHYDKLFKSISW